jgi:hypothetical protein
MDEEKLLAAASESGGAIGRHESNYTIERRGRFWALLDNRTLVCLTVYRRGAVEVMRRLESKGGETSGLCSETA